MPVIVAAGAAYAASAGVTAALAGTAFAAAVGTIGVSLAAGAAGMVVSSVVTAAFSDSSGGDQGSAQGSGQLEQELRDNLLTVRQPITHWQWIYGRTRVGGALTYAESCSLFGGTNNVLHLVITLAGHECEEIGDIYFDDELIVLDGSGAAQGRFLSENGASHAYVYKSLGDEAGQPFAVLVSESAGRWTDAHRQTGRAKINVRLTFNPDIFPNGIPNITAVVKGKKVYDPRSALTAWSANPSLCIADLLCNATWLGATYATEIDEAQLIAAANIDDENVNLAGGGTEDRYTLNGAFSVNVDTRSALARMLSANAGQLHYIGGVFRILPAAYVSPTITLDEDDLRGVPQVEPRLSATDLCNAVKGVYVSEDNSWQPSDFPPVTNATYLAEDNSERSWRELDLAFTKSAATAQRIAKIQLERTRQQISVMWPGKFSCYRLQPGDTVQITFAMLGWSAKVFEVTGATLAIEDDGQGGVRLGCDLALRETASSVFDWSSGEETTVDPAPDTNLPNPFMGVADAPVNVEAFSGDDDLFIGADGTVISRMRVEWDVSTDIYVTSGGHVLLQFKPAASSGWQDAAPVDGGSAETYLNPVEDEVLYDVRVRFQNFLGARSAWTSIQHTVVGKSALPSDIESFTIEGMRLSWTPVADRDVIGYLLRYGPGTRRSWGDAIPLHQGVVTDSPFDMAVQPSGAVTLLAKAVDFSGNESENPAVIVTNLGDPVVANVVETFDLKAAGFVGTKTNGTVSGGDLVADVLSSPLMWNANSAADFWSWDSATLIWASTMYYAMTYVEGITISEALAGSRMTIAATVAGDPWSIEYRENSAKLMWDADPNKLLWNADDTTLYWDDPAWLPWPGAIEVGNNTIIDLRVNTGQSSTQGVISELTVTVDAPDIEEDLNDVSILAAGTRLTLTETYSVIKNVQLTVQNDGGTAITARTEDKSAALGPLVKCLDAGGSATTGLIDARVQGY